MPRPILYATDISPPCRAVFLTATAIGLDLEIREINLHTEENMKPEFVKINPQHTIPTLDDNGFILWDSHAIMQYLVEKYAKNDSLYPKDLWTRAKINQFLQFDNEYLFVTLGTISRPWFIIGKYDIPEEKIEMLNNTFEILEKCLEGKKWLVGNSNTLADISCVSTLSSLMALRPLDKYPNIQNWLKTCEQNLPGYAEKNKLGNEELHKFIKNFLPLPI